MIGDVIVTDGLADAPEAKPVVDLHVPAAPLKVYICAARTATEPDKVTIIESEALSLMSFVTLQTPIAPAVPAAAVALTAP